MLNLKYFDSRGIQTNPTVIKYQEEMTRWIFGLSLVNVLIPQCLLLEYLKQQKKRGKYASYHLLIAHRGALFRQICFGGKR